MSNNDSDDHRDDTNNTTKDISISNKNKYSIHDKNDSYLNPFYMMNHRLGVHYDNLMETYYLPKQIDDDNNSDNNNVQSVSKKDCITCRLVGFATFTGLGGYLFVQRYLHYPKNKNR